MFDGASGVNFALFASVPSAARISQVAVVDFGCDRDLGQVSLEDNTLALPFIHPLVALSTRSLKPTLLGHSTKLPSHRAANRPRSLVGPRFFASVL